MARNRKRIAIAITGTALAALLAANVIFFLSNCDKATCRHCHLAQLYASPDQRALLQDHLPQGFVPSVEGESTYSQIEQIATYLMMEVDPRMGVPVASVEKVPAYATFEGMRQGSVSVMSDGLARVYVAFANKAGIPSRLVKVTNQAGCSHWMAESYVDEEGKWTLVDLQLRRIWVRDDSGEAVGAVQFAQALEDGQAEGLEVALFEGGGVKTRPYRQGPLDPSLFASTASFQFPAPKQLSPSPVRTVTSYLFSTQKSYALNPIETLTCHRLKMTLLTSTAVAGIGFAFFLKKQ